MIDVGLLGTSRNADAQLERYRRLPTVATVVVESRTDSSLLQAGPDGSREVHDTVSTFLEETGVDAIDVRSPPETHRPVIDAAVKCGTDVLCESPLAGSPNQARAIASRVDGADVSVHVGRELRHSPDLARVGAAFDDGAIGALGSLKLERQSPVPPSVRVRDAADLPTTEMLVRLLTDEVDYARRVAGEVSRVFCRACSKSGRTYAHVTVRFESGAVGLIDAAWTLTERDTYIVELAGEQGLLDVSSADGRALTLSGTEHADVDAAPTAADGQYRQLVAFVDAVSNGPSRNTSVEGALGTVDAVAAAVESHELGRPVAVEEVTP